MLAIVSLFLERDVAVCVALHEEPHDPFGKVAEVEPHIKQFFHLLGVYRFMLTVVFDSGRYFLRAKITPKRLIAANPGNGMMLL